MDGDHVAPGKARESRSEGQPLKALILAAGRGSRLGRLTARKPKCLVELQGKSLLERQIFAMEHAGLREIGIVVGYRADMIPGRGVKKIKNRRWKTTYGVFSMLCARRWFGQGPLLVSYGDIFYSWRDLARLLRSQGDVAVAYDPRWLKLWRKRFADPAADAESFRIRGGKITEIGAPHPDIKEVQGQFMGLLKFSPKGLRRIASLWKSLSREQRDQLDMTSMLRRMISRNWLVTGVPVRCPWGEVDSAEDLYLYKQQTIKA